MTATRSPVEEVGWAVPLGVFIAAHPVRPGWATALPSVGGVFWWVLWGFALTYDGV